MHGFSAVFLRSEFVKDIFQRNGKSEQAVTFIGRHTGLQEENRISLSGGILNVELKADFEAIAVLLEA